MSGGSMDYLYSKLEYATFKLDTPERRAFWAHTQLVSKALHDIEWVDSGDSSPGDENAAIMACITKSDVLTAAIETAREQVAELQRLIGP